MYKISSVGGIFSQWRKLKSLKIIGKFQVKLPLVHNEKIRIEKERKYIISAKDVNNDM